MENFKEQLPNEEIINDGQGIFIRKKTLFHGSPVLNINKFNIAGATTVGEGVYLTSEQEKAQGYANLRSKRNGEPTVYKVNIENLKFLDLRKENNIKSILKGFLHILEELKRKKDLPWYFENVIVEVIEKILKDEIYAGNIREVAFSLGIQFTDYVKSLGYDGLITFEGGEGEIGDHDTYLVFDPEKISDLEEEPPSH